MCDACRKADRNGGVNPEPTDLQLHQFRKHLEAGTVPKKMPAWLTAHNRVCAMPKPFKPDLRQAFPKWTYY